MKKDEDKFTVQIDEDTPVDINKLSPDQLDEFLQNELIYDDIKKYQNEIFKELKRIKNTCKNNCNLQNVVLKEVVIINKLLEWIDILSEECQSKEN